MRSYERVACRTRRNLNFALSPGRQGSIQARLILDTGIASSGFNLCTPSPSNFLAFRRWFPVGKMEENMDKWRVITLSSSLFNGSLLPDHAIVSRRDLCYGHVHARYQLKLNPHIFSSSSRSLWCLFLHAVSLI